MRKYDRPIRDCGSNVYCTVEKNHSIYELFMISRGILSNVNIIFVLLNKIQSVHYFLMMVLYSDDSRFKLIFRCCGDVNSIFYTDLQKLV